MDHTAMTPSERRRVSKEISMSSGQGERITVWRNHNMDQLSAGLWANIVIFGSLMPWY